MILLLLLLLLVVVCWFQPCPKWIFVNSCRQSPSFARYGLRRLVRLPPHQENSAPGKHQIHKNIHLTGDQFCQPLHRLFGPFVLKNIGTTVCQIDCSWDFFNKMKPTNPNADTNVEEQRQYLFVTFFSEPTCGTPWLDTLGWHFFFDTLVRHSYLTLLLDTLAWHSCLTLLIDTFYLTHL